MKHQWIPVEKIEFLIQSEAYIICWVLLLLAYLFYLVFLKSITEKRHQNLRSRFFKTLVVMILSSLFSASYFLIADEYIHYQNLIKLSAYFSLVGLLTGAIVIIRVAQIYVYLYLFFRNMSVGVPRLIANIFTFVFSALIFSWIASDIFGIKIVTVLATSAVFTVILGLALQDTLGNMFSGVALQIDKPYQIGDWIEVQGAHAKWVGQVQEITWRATFLTGFSDESILIPNKTIAQSDLLVFSKNSKAPRMNQVFRFAYSVDLELVKKIMQESISNFEELSNENPIRILVTEVNESWITVKIFYSLKNYGDKYRTADKVISKILEQLKLNKVQLAHQIVQVEKIN